MADIPGSSTDEQRQALHDLGQKCRQGAKPPSRQGSIRGLCSHAATGETRCAPAFRSGPSEPNLHEGDIRSPPADVAACMTWVRIAAKAPSRQGSIRGRARTPPRARPVRSSFPFRTERTQPPRGRHSLAASRRCCTRGLHDLGQNCRQGAKPPRIDQGPCSHAATGATSALQLSIRDRASRRPPIIDLGASAPWRRSDHVRVVVVVMIG